MPKDKEALTPENNDASDAEVLEKNTAETPEDDANAPAERRILVFRNPVMKLNPGYILRKVGQAYMIMPTGPRMKNYQGMITLNETGAFLYREMEKPDPTFDKLAEACISEYGATPKEANDAVVAFLQQCVTCGLIDAKDTYINAEGREVTLEEIERGEA